MKKTNYKEIQEMAEQQENKRKNSKNSVAAKKKNNIKNRKSVSGATAKRKQELNFPPICQELMTQDDKFYNFLRMKERGASDTIARKIAGVSESTITYWKKKAHDGITECNEKGMMYSEHKDYKYIMLMEGIRNIETEHVLENLDKLDKLTEDVVVYLMDEEGNYIYDGNGDKIINKIARPANLGAIEKKMKLLNPDLFDEKRSISIEHNVNENKVVMISFNANTEKDVNGKLIHNEEDFLNELGMQQTGLTEFIEQRAADDNLDNIYENGDNDE